MRFENEIKRVVCDNFKKGIPFRQENKAEDGVL